MQTRPFRRSDRITVHHADGRTSKGRVICHNRRNKYGLSVVVLFEKERGNEVIETFLKTGRRYLSDDVYITHQDTTQVSRPTEVVGG